ncbi:putative ribonuclease H-like domain-containing protein, partial [Tanacetum coccineum]
EPQPDSSPAHTSEVPLEQQTDPSLRPSPTTTIPNSIPETSGGTLGGHSSSDKSLSGNEGDMTIQNTVDHMETKNAQNEGRTREMVDEDKEIDENILSTKDVFSTNKEGVSTDMEKVSTDRPIVSTDRSKVSTEEHIEGTDEQVEGTKEHIEGTEEQVESTDGHKKGTEDEIVTQATQTSTQTPTSTIFGDDETIAKVLLNMSQAKAVSRENEKGVELKDVKETDRPRPTSTRSLLTLKPLPKIDPKDKGKKKIKEEDESESESDGIPQAEKKFKQLESDEELARKMQEEWEEEEERNRIAEEQAANEALIRNFDDIKARIEADRLLAEKLQEQEREQFTIEERAKFLHDTIAAQRRFLAQQRSEAIRNRPPTKNQLRNQMMTYLKHAYMSIFDREDLNAVYQLVMDRFQDEIPEGFDRVLWGDLMVMFNPDDENEFWNSQLDWYSKKNYPLRKEVLMHMLKLKLESEEDSTMALELIRVNYPEQTATGKGTSKSVDGLVVAKNFKAKLVAEKMLLLLLRKAKLIKGTQDNRRRDAWNSRNKDGSRTRQKEDSKALVTIDGEGGRFDNLIKMMMIYALMAYNSSGLSHRVLHARNKGISQGLKKVESNVSCSSIRGPTLRLLNMRALKNKGIVDSRCSRHMTRNKAYLAEFQDFNGGPVAFGGSKGYITGGLACLIAKATTDESNKWHRRLGHVNFKNLNKLVKGNLVRGLPSKLFQNDHTCVACQKGKQHKASLANFTNLETVVNVIPIPTLRIHSSRPSALILGDPTSVVQTRSKKLLKIEMRVDASVRRIAAVQIQKYSTCRACLLGSKAISTKWVYSEFRKDERGVVVRNKARIEAIRIFLAFASYMGFIVYQMDVKSAFLYGKIDEEVYVSQPLGFLVPKKLRKFYKVVKALYGLHQAPRAWYMIELFNVLTASRAHDIMFAVCAYFYVSCKSDKKSTQVVVQFLSSRLIYLPMQKETIVATSTTEAEYVAASLIEVRESLRRVTDGTDALLIPTLFILWLDKVSTDSANLVPLGKVCTAIETLKKNTAKGSTFEPHTDSSPAHTSEVPIEQQNDPSPRPSPSTIIPDSIPEASGGNIRGHSSSDKSLSGNEGELTLQSVYDLCLSLCASGFRSTKEIPNHLKAQIKKSRSMINCNQTSQSMDAKYLLEAKFGKKELLKETMGTQRVCNVEQIESSDKQRKSKEKGVELKYIEETDRPRPTSTRSLLTLNPLPKIDPKDKGKKKIEDEDESTGIPEAEKKFKQLESDEEMA